MAKKQRETTSGMISPIASPADQSRSKPVTPVLPQQRALTKSPDFFSIYTNDIQVQTSSWDVRIGFAEAGDLLPGEPAVLNVIQRGEIHMSPQLAKRMVRIITEQLNIYEAQFGEIPQPKD